MKEDAQTYALVCSIISWARFITERGGGNIKFVKSYPINTDNPPEIDKPLYYGTME